MVSIRAASWMRQFTIMIPLTIESAYQHNGNYYRCCFSRRRLTSRALWWIVVWRVLRLHRIARQSSSAGCHQALLRAADAQSTCSRERSTRSSVSHVSIKPHVWSAVDSLRSKSNVAACNMCKHFLSAIAFLHPSLEEKDCGNVGKKWRASLLVQVVASAWDHQSWTQRRTCYC